MTMKAVGQYIRTLREGLGISQAELAKRAGVSNSQVHRIEAGDTQSGASLVARVAKAVQADPVDFFELLTSEGEAPEVGAQLAQKKMSSPPKSKAIRAEFTTLYSQMDDFQLGRWFAIGERILQENDYK